MRQGVDIEAVKLRLKNVVDRISPAAHGFGRVGGPRTIIALVIAGPLLVGAMIGYLVVGLLFDDGPVIEGPPPLPPEWLEEEPSSGHGAGDERSPGFGKTF